MDVVAVGRCGEVSVGWSDLGDGLLGKGRVAAGDEAGGFASGVDTTEVGCDGRDASERQVENKSEGAERDRRLDGDRAPIAQQSPANNPTGRKTPTDSVVIQKAMAEVPAIQRATAGVPIIHKITTGTPILLKGTADSLVVWQVGVGV